ncbi:MAG: hypothetical protein KAV41_00920 [Candidatus Pacebacteria bacterium]|nr:hypothetical protein [Candidatus Paceibacterota bacterium]
MNKLEPILKQLSQFNTTPRADGFYVDFEGHVLTKLSFEIDARAIIVPTREGEFIKDTRNFFENEEYSLSYPGTASMKHLVIFSPNGGGIFIGGIPTYKFAKIKVKKIGKQKLLITYNSTEHKLYFLHFKKDWRERADTFKRIMHLDEKYTNERQTPKIFLQIGIKDSFGNCGIKHFSELKEIIDYACDELGDRLIIHFYGTNTAGFDRMFPNYAINPDLGGKESLTELVAYIKEKGLLTSHHYNPRIADTDWLKQNADYIPAIVLYKDGSPIIEKYKKHTHFVMNPNNEHWFKRCVENIDYLKSIGFDYIQLDQFTYQRNFYNPEKALQLGYKRMMEECDARGIRYWLEGVSDIHKLYNENFYQILTRDSHRVWDDDENRRGYPYGKSYPEFFMFFYPNAKVSYQLVTENNNLETFEDKLKVARSLDISIYGIQMMYYCKHYKPLLKRVIEKIKEYGV